MSDGKKKPKIVTEEELRFRAALLYRIDAAFGNITDEELSKKLGIHRNTIANWRETKGSPSPWIVSQSARLTNRRPAWLAFGEGSMDSFEETTRDAIAKLVLKTAREIGSLTAQLDRNSMAPERSRAAEPEADYGDIQSFVASALQHNEDLQRTLLVCVNLHTEDVKITAALSALHSRGADALRDQRRVLEKLQQRLAQAQEALSGRIPGAGGASAGA